jgi:hypothetical protein
VLEPEPRDGLGHVRGLVGIDARLGLPAVDVAEAAVTGAGLAEDHERRRARIPALVDVRAARFFADGIQA